MDGFVPGEMQTQYPDGINLDAKYMNENFCSKKLERFDGVSATSKTADVRDEELERARRGWKISGYEHSNITGFNSKIPQQLAPIHLNAILAKISNVKDYSPTGQVVSKNDVDLTKTKIVTMEGSKDEKIATLRLN